MRSLLSSPIVVLTLVCLLLAPALPRTAPRIDLELAIADDEFTVNEDPRFLVVASYYDALDVSLEDVESDFNYLESKGVGGVRIFANWWHYTQKKWDYPNTQRYYANDTLIDKDGNLRSGSLSKLLSILDIAKDEGLIVDLTFSAETVGDCPAQNCTPGTNGPSLTLQEFTDGISDLATELSNGGSAYKHVFLDLQNEFDQNSHAGENYGYTPGQIEGIRNAVKAIDAGIIVTASTAGSVDPDDAGQMSEDANLDVASWHEDRYDGYWDYTAANIGYIRSTEDEAPIYLQEPERMRPGQSWPDENDLAENVYNAKTGGAAAWGFHTGASHHLDGSDLYTEMEAAERAFLDCLNQALSDGTCPSAPTPQPDANEAAVFLPGSPWRSALKPHIPIAG